MGLTTILFLCFKTFSFNILYNVQINTLLCFKTLSLEMKRLVHCKVK